jgi:hypothetical protein
VPGCQSPARRRVGTDWATIVEPERPTESAIWAPRSVSEPKPVVRQGVPGPIAMGKDRSDRGKGVVVLRVKKYGWKAITIALGALVGLATQRLIEMPWKLVRGSTPPKVLADRRSPWLDAVSWAVASGVGVGVARLVAIRAAAGVWEAAVHEPPPEPGLAESTAA